jgi:hypothetical protein
MKTLLVAVIVTMLTAGTWASAEEVSPISPAQLQKLLKFVDTIGAKQEFPPPTAQNLGLSSDPNLVLPVVVVVTDDHNVYFCRSGLNPADYIVWVRAPDNQASYMFLTHADFKLIRAMRLLKEGFPDMLDVAASQTLSIYKYALVALAKDVDKSKSPSR